MQFFERRLKVGKTERYEITDIDANWLDGELLSGFTVEPCGPITVVNSGYDGTVLWMYVTANDRAKAKVIVRLATATRSTSSDFHIGIDRADAC